MLLDLRKAFDLVNHTVLLGKLAIYACSEQAMRWLSSYLSELQQIVQFKRTLFNPSEVITGVPQGSILRPLFFIVFMNDIPNKRHCGLIYIVVSIPKDVASYTLSPVNLLLPTPTRFIWEAFSHNHNAKSFVRITHHCVWPRELIHQYVLIGSQIINYYFIS